MRLRELFEAPAQKIVAVMPGGFHPFHPGHKSLYDWAVETFGKDNVYVAATNDTKSRPFPFDIKQKLATMAGVPTNRFIQVKSPFNALSYDNIIGNAAQTALVFVRSEKDKTSHPLPDQVRKSDGNMGYLISYKDNDDLETADTHGYLAYGPTIDFDFSGMSIKSASELRATWPEMSDEDKLKAAELMYPGNAQTATQLLNQALSDPEAPVGESLEEKQTKGTLPDKIEPLKMPTPPKAPDATIPRTRNGYTTDAGVTYKQDKYNENIMTVSNDAGIFTFDDARLIKWESPRIEGYGQIYDFIRKTITVKADTIVNTGDGDVVVSTDAVYDLKGNLKNAGNTKISSGGFSVGTGTRGTEIRYSMGSLEIRLKANPRKAQAMNKDQLKGLAGKLKPLFSGKEIWKAARLANKYADIKLLWNGAAKHPAEIETLMKQSQGE